MAKWLRLPAFAEPTTVVSWGRFSNVPIPWTIRYDEVLTVFEGELRVHSGSDQHLLRQRDCIWLPAGAELVYEATSALVYFAIHPTNWQESPKRQEKPKSQEKQ